MSEQTYTRIAQAVILIGFLLGMLYADPASSQSADSKFPAMSYAATADARVDNKPASETGFLVVAADRGFQGNEEIRDAFEVFAQERNAALAFVTDSRTRDTLQAALKTLAQAGAKRAVVLPVFISEASPRLVLVRQLLDPRTGNTQYQAGDSPARPALPISFARPFGASHLAVESLSDRFRAIRKPQGNRVVVVGYGAVDDDNRKQMEADWRRIAERAAEGFGFASVHTVVWFDRAAPNRVARWRENERAVAEAASADSGTVVVPFHLGRKLDSMMSLHADVKRVMPPGAELLPEDP